MKKFYNLMARARGVIFASLHLLIIWLTNKHSGLSLNILIKLYTLEIGLLIRSHYAQLLHMHSYLVVLEIHCVLKLYFPPLLRWCSQEQLFWKSKSVKKTSLSDCWLFCSCWCYMSQSTVFSVMSEQFPVFWV